MYVTCLESLDALVPLRESWDALACDNLFRGLLWQRTWAEHFCGPQDSTRSLRVLVVYSAQSQSVDESSVVAILPCYQDRTFARGRVWRLIGDGEVCSDHLGLLCSAEKAPEAGDAIASHLLARDDWDCLDFTYFDKTDVASNCLSNALADHGCFLETSPGPNCWSIALPASWGEFLSMQSKSHRKHIRRLERSAAKAGSVDWHLCEGEGTFMESWQQLIDLHQQRRLSLGEPGCFASETWASFHNDIAQRLLAAGHLQLSYLELQGKPAAAEYQFANSTTTYAYQGGLDPGRLDEQPGRLSLIRTIQHAILQGHSRYDLMRGDEPYKPHWGAEPQGTVRVQATPPRTVARWRYAAFDSVRKAGRVVRKVTGLLG